MSNGPIQCLRLILGDQLHRGHSWFRECDASVTFLIMELRSETDYVRHHIRKVLAFFLAMRHFARELEKQGHKVIYLRLDDPENKGNIPDNVHALVKKGAFQRFEYQAPDEYRLDEVLSDLANQLDIQTACADTEHFLTARDAVRSMFEGKKTYLMETFYRSMRKRYNVLMEDDGETPLSGRWNYDKENRNKLPSDQSLPEVLSFPHEVADMKKMLEKSGVEIIGHLEGTTLDWPVTREENLELLAHFTETGLPRFGEFQDALSTRDPFLFHSRLSFALNTKMLHPLEVVNACIAKWRENPDIDMAQIEGFVRQIIGWREFMRGVYWAKMPGYAEQNFLDHQADLPAFFWTGQTDMNCLRHAIGQSLDLAYAHHIQRLMITGNFALILGVAPDQVDAWYLGIYIDAIEWVEITNTRGMSQFADGGLIATKPYAASANYVNKMGDYCRNCPYDHKAKYGKKACPFNSLYWDFIDRHRDELRGNHRMSMMYSTWDRKDGAEREKILRRAAYVKSNIEEF